MLRSATSKVMWVGRATVFLVGLAVILALLFGVASTVSAHTGNKGFFHLGHKNVSKAVSTLVKQGPGPALSLVVGTGQPPLQVNATAGKATNLNADKLDGLDQSAFLRSTGKAADSDKLDGKDSSEFLPTGGKAADSDKLDGKDPNELVRSGLGVSQTAFSFASFTDRTSVTVNAPDKGFVIVNGAVYAQTSSSSCNPCYAHIEILNSTTNERSTVLIESLGNGTTALQDDVLPTTWVFPVDPGDNTFQLRTAPFPSSAAINFVNPRLSAVYVPYGATGASTLGASSQQVSPMSGEGKESEDGTIRK